MSIAVVIPTIPGREALYDRTVAAYRATADVTIITVRNRPTCGEGWNDGAAAAAGTDCEYLHLSADDVEPQPGWDTACMAAADAGVYPSARIPQIDGTLHSCGSMGGGMLLPECATGTPCGASPFPFMRMDMWPRIGPSIPTHYYSDDYLAWKARLAGLRVEVVREFCLLHLEGTVGRQKLVQRAMADRALFLATVGVESPAPTDGEAA